MSWLGDNLSFEKFQLGDWWSELKRHPQRAFIGAMDKPGTMLWNKILGTDYKPMVNYAGGPTGDTFNRADQQGINTGPARGAHKVADTVATIWGLGGLMGSSAMGGGAGASGGMGLGGDAMGGSAGTLGAADSATVGGGAYAGSAPGSVNLVNAGGTMSTGLGGAGAGGGFSSLFNSQNLGTFNQGLQTAQNMRGLMSSNQQQPMAPPPQFGTGRDPIGDLLRQQQEMEALRAQQRRGLLGY